MADTIRQSLPAKQCDRCQVWVLHYAWCVTLKDTRYKVICGDCMQQQGLGKASHVT